MYNVAKIQYTVSCGDVQSTCANSRETMQKKLARSLIRSEQRIFASSFINSTSMFNLQNPVVNDVEPTIDVQVAINTTHTHTHTQRGAINILPVLFFFLSFARYAIYLHTRFCLFRD